MNKNWEEYFLDLLPGIASKSKDPSTKVGAIITGKDHGIRSTGYNNLPRFAVDNDPKKYERPLKYKWFEHAERNAIYYAAKTGVPLDGCILYVDWLPCSDCARGIVQVGISKVVIDADSASYKNPELRARWQEDHAIANQILQECGVEVTLFTRKKI